MISVGTYEAKSTLTNLLKQVANGESVTITNHKKEVARLVPPAGVSSDSISEVVGELLSFSKGISLGEDLSLRDLIEEGRR